MTYQKGNNIIPNNCSKNYKVSSVASRSQINTYKYNKTTKKRFKIEINQITYVQNHLNESKIVTPIEIKTSHWI